MGPIGASRPPSHSSFAFTGYNTYILSYLTTLLNSSSSHKTFKLLDSSAEICSQKDFPGGYRIWRAALSRLRYTVKHHLTPESFIDLLYESVSVVHNFRRHLANTYPSITPSYIIIRIRKQDCSGLWINSKIAAKENTSLWGSPQQQSDESVSLWNDNRGQSIHHLEKQENIGHDKTILQSSRPLTCINL